MPLNIRNEEVNVLAERLATRKHISKTAAVKLALENELRLVDDQPSVQARVRAIQDEFLSYAPTGLAADKAFYDSLNDE